MRAENKKIRFEARFRTKRTLLVLLEGANLSKVAGNDSKPNHFLSFPNKKKTLSKCLIMQTENAVFLLFSRYLAINVSLLIFKSRLVLKIHATQKIIDAYSEVIRDFYEIRSGRFAAIGFPVADDAETYAERFSQLRLTYSLLAP